MTPNRYYKSYSPLHRPHHRVGNPYFRSRSADRLAMSRISTSTSRWSFKVWLYLFLSFLFLLALLWLLLFSNIFIIQHIEVKGTYENKARIIKEMAEQQTNDTRLWILPQSRLVVFKKAQLLEKINNNYIFSNIRIQKKIPQTLIIQLVEKSAAVYWFENDIYYLLDAEGWVLETQTTPLTDTVVIYNNAEPKITARRLSESERSVIEPVGKLQSLLRSRFSYLKAKQITVTQERDTVIVVLEGGQLLYLNSKQPMEAQLDRLDTLIKYEIKNRLPTLNYIDLRFGDKVYYK